MITLERYQSVRCKSEELCAHLQPEDWCAQAMPDCSPPKWHLAHTSWFFSTFLPEPRGISCGSDSFRHIFNSYYQGVGSAHPRHRRGAILRPNIQEVLDYRHAVDEHITNAMNTFSDQELHLLELGCHHEQQHQELLLTDLK